MRPALDTEYFFETITGLAADGKTNSKGVPSFLQMVLTLNKYNKVFRIARPSFFIQKIIFALATPFSLLRSYRADYKKYLDWARCSLHCSNDIRTVKF